jgi:translation initiation factor 1
MRMPGDQTRGDQMHGDQMHGDQTRRVYSTDGERIEQSKSRPPKAAPRGASSRDASSGGAPRPAFPDDGFVRIRREKSGRGGKTVTAIYGLRGNDRELDDLLKALKQRCGAGGTREGDTLEIQGDHRERVEAALVALGHRVKQAGG